MYKEQKVLHTSTYISELHEEKQGSVRTQHKYGCLHIFVEQ